MPGRKNIPTNILKKKGTLRHSRHDDRLEVDPGVPACPAMLGPEGKKEWKRLMGILKPLGILSELDRAGLTVICEHWQVYCDCVKEMKTQTMMIKSGREDVLKINPLIILKRQAAAEMGKMLTEFAMTPASRARVKIDKEPKKKDDPTLKYFNGKTG